jgi:hypothetical protein
MRKASWQKKATRGEVTTFSLVDIVTPHVLGSAAIREPLQGLLTGLFVQDVETSFDDAGIPLWPGPDPNPPDAGIRPGPDAADPDGRGGATTVPTITGAIGANSTV